MASSTTNESELNLENNVQDTMSKNSLLNSEFNSNLDQPCSPKGNSHSGLIHLDEVLSDLKFGIFQVKVLLLTGCGYFAVCSEMMMFIFLSAHCKKEWNLADYQFSWLPFSTGIAGIIGGFLFGTVSDHFGRRLPFIFGMISVALFGLISAFADSFPLLVAFRCMVTFGIAAFEAAGFVLLLGEYIIYYLLFSGMLGMTINTIVPEEGYISI